MDTMETLRNEWIRLETLGFFFFENTCPESVVHCSNQEGLAHHTATTHIPGGQGVRVLMGAMQRWKHAENNRK
jgi:hypothetical protein